MDKTSQLQKTSFAVIGHQESWECIAGFINTLRKDNLPRLTSDQVRQIFQYVPPRDVFKILVTSKNGKQIVGAYIESFVAPDQLDSKFLKTNIEKVKMAAGCANKLGARIVSLGGFTSIVLEGNVNLLPATGPSVFTTGNSLTAAFVVKGVEKAALSRNIKLNEASMLIVGATGDIGMACSNYFCSKTKRLLLCSRARLKLEQLALSLGSDNDKVQISTSLDDLVPLADIIICVTSSLELKLTACKPSVIICDAGYPKNLDQEFKCSPDSFLFHGGMGLVKYGYEFFPDYEKSFYHFPAKNIAHGCALEAIVLAFEEKYVPYSTGKGNILPDKIEDIYQRANEHGIVLAPFFNSSGLLTMLQEQDYEEEPDLIK